jgi:hypothetical protein
MRRALIEMTWSEWSALGRESTGWGTRTYRDVPLTDAREYRGRKAGPAKPGIQRVTAVVTEAGYAALRLDGVEIGWLEP